MGIYFGNKFENRSISEKQGVVDLKSELLNALEELKKARKKNRQLKEHILRVEEGMHYSDNEYYNL